MVLPRGTSRNAAWRLLTEQAEHHGWELDRLRLYPTEHGECACAAGSCGSLGPCSYRCSAVSRGSAVRQEVVEYAGAELQAFQRNPLVNAMEHAGEVEVGREPQRREPEPAYAQLRERLVIRTTE